MLVVVPYTSCRGAMEILPQHFAKISLEHFISRSMAGLTIRAAVFLPALLCAEIFRGYRKSSRIRPSAALSAVALACTLPYAPLATLCRARARLLPREPTLPRSAALSSPGSSRLAVPAGHNTPLQPATLPPRGQQQNGKAPC